MSSLVLVGGARPVALLEDLAVRALVQGRRRGLETHQVNQAVELAATPAVGAAADFSWAVDFEQPGRCVAWARERVAAGQRFDVVFGVREFAQVAVAEVAEATGAPGNPPAVVDRVHHKDVCREMLAGAGFMQPAFQVCGDVRAAERFLESSDGPWVVKPRDGMGSLGVSLVTGRGDLPGAVAGLPGGVPFLVEEFVVGQEFSVEGLFLGGQPHVLAVTGKELYEAARFVEAGHVLPAPIPQAWRREIEHATVAALRALEVRFGVFHVELWWTARGVVLGEVHVRGGGDWIHLMLEHAIPGLELFGLVYDDALGRPVVPPLAPTRAAAVRFLAPPPGRLVGIEGWEAVAGHPAVLRADLAVRPGAEIKPVRQSDDRVGAIVVGADTPEQARQLVSELADTVRFTVEPPTGGPAPPWPARVE